MITIIQQIQQQSIERMGNQLDTSIQNKQQYSLSSRQEQQYNYIIDHPILKYTQIPLLKERQGESWPVMKTHLPMKHVGEIQIWLSKLNKIKQLNCQYLLLPDSIQKKEESVDGNYKQIYLTFKCFPYLLIDQIKMRRQLDRQFQQDQIWYLLWVLAESANTLHNNNKIIGDVRPHNIVFNETGQLRVISHYSWPCEETNFNKTVYENTITYLSPEQVQLVKRLEQVDSSNPLVSQSFAIGLTLLSVIYLEDLSWLYKQYWPFSVGEQAQMQTQVYNQYRKKFSSFNFDENALVEYVVKLPFLKYRKSGGSKQVQINYSRGLIQTIKNLCILNPNKRSCVTLIHKLMVPHRNEIINFVPFNFGSNYKSPNSNGPVKGNLSDNAVASTNENTHISPQKMYRVYNPTHTSHTVRINNKVIQRNTKLPSTQVFTYPNSNMIYRQPSSVHFNYVIPGVQSNNLVQHKNNENKVQNNNYQNDPSGAASVQWAHPGPSITDNKMKKFEQNAKDGGRYIASTFIPVSTHPIVVNDADYYSQLANQLKNVNTYASVNEMNRESYPINLATSIIRNNADESKQQVATYPPKQMAPVTLSQVVSKNTNSVFHNAYTHKMGPLGQTSPMKGLYNNEVHVSYVVGNPYHQIKQLPVFGTIQNRYVDLSKNSVAQPPYSRTQQYMLNQVLSKGTGQQNGADRSQQNRRNNRTKQEDELLSLVQRQLIKSKSLFPPRDQ